ncbi:MAG: hypothetical protein J0H00_15380 [Burkholderiales bacterium]|nr:hypothetical protein [Burkholderiales bacterium]
MDAIRELARREGRPISEVVNELLAEGLQKRRSKAAAGFERSDGRPTGTER